MTSYHPDLWVVIKVTDKGTKESHFRVFASWYGGFARGDSWKMNSGIVSCDVNDSGNVCFFGESGSVYVCHKDSYGTSSYSYSVLQSFINEPESPVEIEVLEDRDWVRFFEEINIKENL